MKRFLQGVALGSIAFLVGCASIVSGTTQPISFNSTPPGATILINGADMGKTPTTLHLKRNENYAVSIQLEGYMPETVNITRSMNGWIFGNIIFGGLIGIVIDAASGAMYKLTPEQVTATMGEKLAINADDSVMIAVVMDVDPSWEKIAQLETR
ncbi:MAG TPA: PEGA domain-containing protein [Gammaproteobacteria bacterium]